MTGVQWAMSPADHGLGSAAKRLDRTVWAYTARADLWPPGSRVDCTRSTLWLALAGTPRGSLTRAGLSAQEAGLGAPGVAEALVLADQVVVHAQTTPHTWTPIGGPP